jgi:transcriptional regulator with XRE-family HTH domain
MNDPILDGMPLSLDALARQQIRQWLQSTGITQVNLAEQIGRNQAWMSRYLAGDFDADLETLRKIAQVFGHNLATLFNIPLLNPDETELLELYRALGAESRKIAKSLLRDWTRPRGPRRRARSQK